jgi:hypothetical protein
MKNSVVVSALFAAFALSACSSSGGSGLSAAEINALPITAKMPTQGKAVYKGKSSENRIVSGQQVTLRTDIQLDADFATSNVGATVSNINISSGSKTLNVTGSLTGTGYIYGPYLYVYTDGVLSTPQNGAGYSYATIDGTFKGPNADGVEGTLIIEGSGGGAFTAGKL